jgi:hypothetical protein
LVVRIPVKVYEEMKLGDIIEATIVQQKHGLVVDFPIEWFDGYPYRVYKQPV